MTARGERGRLLGAALVLVGIVWLLVALGVLPAGAFLRFLELWPLLLVGGGLDLIGEERVERFVLGLPWTVVALGLMVVLALLYPAAGLGGPLETREVRLERSGADRADVRLAPGAAELALRGGAGDLLLAGELRDRARISVDAQGNRVRDVAVTRGRGSARDALWTLALSERMPVRLEIDGGSGAARLELERVDLAELRLDLGSGPTALDLPLGGPERVRAEIDGGSGPLRVNAPRGARVDLDVDTGSGPFDLVAERGVDLTLVLDAGSGPVDLDLPDEAAVRLEAADDGSGPLRLPAWLERVEGDPDREEGVWQSANWREDGPSVLVRLDDVGSGPITLR